jgi:hypothetical protein
VGQNDWLELLEELSDSEESYRATGRCWSASTRRPSFDPFLLREHLRRRELRPADCYFAIAPADREQMRASWRPRSAILIEQAYRRPAGRAGHGRQAGRDPARLRTSTRGWSPCA